MDSQKNNPKSLSMLVASMLIFGTIGIFRRMLPMESALIAFFRGVIGCLFLIIFIRLRGGKIRHGLDRGTFIKLTLTGAAIGLNWMLLFEAYNYTTVSVATLCYYMQPTFVVVLSSILFREKMTVKKAGCSLMALIGMVLISGVVETGLPAAGDLKGILFGLGAACLYATVVLLNKSIREVDSYEKTIIQLGAAAAVMVPYLLVTGSFTGNIWNIKIIGLLIFVGIIHTGMSYVLYFGSMDGLRTQTVALFSYIDPVTALILSAFILNEQMTGLGILGAIMILGSAVICEI